MLPEDITTSDFTNYINTASSALSAYDYEIRSTHHQTTRATVWAIVNTTSDPITQLATIFTPDEISFLKRVLDAMFETYNTPRHEIMAITGMQATRLHKPPDQGRRGETQGGAETQGSAGAGLTMGQAEKVMQGLVEMGWMEKSRKGYFSLSPRALMELRGWLLETYNDDEDEDDEGSGPRVKVCLACKEIITVVSSRCFVRVWGGGQGWANGGLLQGQRCPRRSCGGRLHNGCTQKFFTMQKSRKCPLCKTEWTGEDHVGELAAPSNSAASSKRRDGESNGMSQSVRQDGNGDNEDTLVASER
jgi:hypothetical protein